MEPLTLIMGGSLLLSAVTGIGGMIQNAKASKEFNANAKSVLSQSSNDMNLMKGIAMGQSGLGVGGGMPQMAAPGAYPWA